MVTRMTLRSARISAAPGLDLPHRLPWPSIGGLAAAALGAGWLGAAVVTGQRYPGLSLAWLAPFAVGAGVSAGAALVLALVASRLAAPDPAAVAARALGPLWLVWLLAAVVLLSADANHYWAHWPRLRTAALVLLGAGVALATQIEVLRLVERRHGALARLATRTGAPLLVGAGTFAVLLASGGGHLYTPDEWAIYAVAVGIVRHGAPAAYAGEPYPLHHVGSVFPDAERLPDGSFPRAYSKYGVVTSLLAAPIYAVAQVTGPGPDLPQPAFPFENLARPLVPLLVNPLATAAIAALLFVVASDLSGSRRGAAFAAGAYAFGSLAWPFSKTLMSMTLAGGFLLGSFWAASRAAQAVWAAPARGVSQRRWAALAGAAAGLACATRYETFLFAAPLVWLCVWPPGDGWRSRFARAWWFGAGAAAIIVPLVVGMNALRTGNPLDPGYGGEGTLSTLAEKPWYGLFGILLSPGCGLVTHTPLMALGLLALIWLWEDAPRPAFAAGAVTLLGIAYYGSLATWCGFATWGPRYLLVLAPFMALPLASLWRRIHRPVGNPFALLLLGGAAAWSVTTNLLAVLIDFNRGWQDHWAHDLTYPDVTWLPYFTGITTHWRLFRQWLLDAQGGLDLYLLYTVPGGAIVIVVLLGIAVTCFAAVLASRDPAEAIPAPRGATGANASSPHRASTPSGESATRVAIEAAKRIGSASFSAMPSRYEAS